MNSPLARLALLAATLYFALPVLADAKDKESKPTRRILAIGGGGFQGFDGALPRYFLSLTGKKNPLVYFLPTAVGDSDRWIVEWYETMNELDCRPRHLKLFSESPRMKNLEETLLAADAIYVNGGNTLNMLAIWKAHGVDKILRKAYDRGIVLGGDSAGMICWFEQANTDSRPEKLTAMECLGFLKGSACPHFNDFGDRKHTLFNMIRDGELKDGIACSDFAALLYEDDKLARVFEFGHGGRAFHVRLHNGKVVEEPIPSERIPLTPKYTVNLWPGRPAGDNADRIGEEKFLQLMVKGKPYEVDGKPTKWLANVTTPTLSIYPAPTSIPWDPDRKLGPRPAVLICPGGGYHNLGWDVEGTEIAEWLNSIGITAIILKYRCPRRPGDVKGVPPAGPLMDAQRAVSLLRSKAKEWNINPKSIGMVGFSAGGHLVGSTCTNFEKRTYAPIDAVDKVGCRPDFGIMCYSGYFKVGDGLTPTVKTPVDAPPMFFVHAKDDAISEAAHSIAFHKALKDAGANAQILLFDTGGHGFGVRRGSPCFGWTKTCAAWMRKQGVFKK